MTTFTENKGFGDYFLSSEMLQALEKVGYQTPTPVQHAAIPLVMAGIDLIVQSQTGTGKTAAFGVPSIELLDPRPGIIEMLVLAPTRELARQVAAEIERLGEFKGINVATIYGGTSYEKQYEEIDQASVICATPGRLVDILKRGKISFDNLRVLCLDEADEMLSMGFAEDLNTIIGYLPEERQSLLFSATITPEVKALANNMLYYPEFITFSSNSVAAEDVEHSFFMINGVSRTRDLLAVLQHEEPDNAIIFANTKDDTFMVTRFLKRHGYRADVLNGDLAQKDRENTLRALKEGQIDFLVATDVAARGIDISDLTHVINYTLPESAEVYIHRTGRTGRAGKKGKAMSLVSPKEMGVLFNIRKLYKFPIHERTLPSSEDIRQARQERRVESVMSSVMTNGVNYGPQMGVAQALVGSDDVEKVRFVAKLLAFATNYSGPLSSPAAELPVEDVQTERPARDEKPARDERRATKEESKRPLVPETTEKREVLRVRPSKLAKQEEVEAPEPRAEESQKPRRTRRNSRTQSNEVTAAPSAPVAEESKPRRQRQRPDSQDDKGILKEARQERTEKKDDDRRRSKRKRRGGRDRERTESTPLPPLPEIPREFAKVWINRGKTHSVDRDAIVEMVCYMAGIEPEDLGSVQVEQTFSYAEVREDYLYDIIQAMNQQEYQGATIAAEPARR